MISDKKTTQFILKDLSSKERNIYADFLALADAIRSKIVEDGKASRLSNPKYCAMYEVYAKVENLQHKLIQIN